ncbi:MAG: S41 family peptidase [Lachnospiraceae bacterium]|nr:S41 family peptidase [Lachnospiraceae bacterium]
MEEYQAVEQNKTEKKSTVKSVLLFCGGILLGALVVSVIFAVMIYRMTPATVAASGDEGSVMDDEVIHKLMILEDGIDEYYLGDVDEEALEDSLYHGLIAGLDDPYSTYYSEEELEEVLESAEGIYYGIGAYIGLDTASGYCKITKVMEGTPAMEAGLLAEDIIVEVDGEDMWGITTSEIVTYIKGPEHTTVDLTIYREGELDYLEITVERRKIETPTIVYEMDENKIATIQITEFDEITTEQFIESMEQAEKAGMKALVIDLRDNPGGSLKTVVDIANELLPEGLVVYTEDKEGNRQEYKCKGKNEIQVPVVVLVNGNSASASEILAGAIQDYKKGTILGTTTFGKGIVQKIFPMSDGSALKLTISHYYTPAGNDIHGVGIVPDEELELDAEKYLEDGTDNQMDRAKEILLEQIGE